MRLGLIGAGRIGSNHAGIIMGLEAVAELLIADAAPERAGELAAALPRGRAADLDELFATSDGVLIATTTDTHAELLHRAAASGVTAFCEKPIALDLESTRRVVAAVDEAGIDVQMGFQRRYDPAMAAIRRRLDSGDLGTPYLVRSQTHDPAPPPLDYIPVSGGIFKDCLIHDIDIVRHVSGQEVIAVTAAGAVLGFDEIGRLGDVDTAAAVLELSGGTLAQLSALRHDPVGYDVRLEVFGSKDSVAAGWHDRTPIRTLEPTGRPLTDPITTFWDRFDAAYRAELAAFVEVVAGRQRPLSNHHDAYEDLRVAAACDLAMAEGRRVEMREVP